MGFSKRDNRFPFYNMRITNEQHHQLITGKKLRRSRTKAGRRTFGKGASLVPKSPGVEKHPFLRQRSKT